MKEERKYDWSTFKLRIPVKATVDDLYQAWASRKGIESWFLRSSEFRSAGGEVLSPERKASTGDSFEWYWHGWDDNTVERGRVLAANGLDTFSFTFGMAGNVTVKIAKEDGESVVELTQEAIPTDDEFQAKFHLGCSNGWTFYLANLKSVLEGGLDLRNRNLNLRNVVNS